MRIEKSGRPNLLKSQNRRHCLGSFTVVHSHLPTLWLEFRALCFLHGIGRLAQSLKSSLWFGLYRRYSHPIPQDLSVVRAMAQAGWWGGVSTATARWGTHVVFGLDIDIPHAAALEMANDAEIALEALRVLFCLEDGESDVAGLGLKTIQERNGRNLGSRDAVVAVSFLLTFSEKCGKVVGDDLALLNRLLAFPPKKTY